MLLHLTLLHDSLQVPIVSDDQCRSQTNLTIASFMLCAGGNGAGPCKVCEGGLCNITGMLEDKDHKITYVVILILQHSCQG